MAIGECGSAHFCSTVAVLVLIPFLFPLGTLLAAEQNWSAPRTEYGVPDLQGNWSTLIRHRWSGLSIWAYSRRVNR